MAMYDHLTQLPNRTLFREVFQHEASFAKRHGQQLALLFVDLDRFKAINDTLGHAAGDRLLLTVSERLRAAVRGSDLVCRVSGDEFLLLLREAISPEAVQVTVQRLLAGLSENLELQGGVQANVSASIGIALFPQDGEEFDELVRHADMAMYQAKEEGRSRYSFYQSHMDALLAERLELERELAEAIRAGQLLLHYQPIVDANDARVGVGRGVGALAASDARPALPRCLHPGGRGVRGRSASWATGRWKPPASSCRAGRAWGVTPVRWRSI
jgi:diguanylate cyclase (GGDEF)-like protein